MNKKQTEELKIKLIKEYDTLSDNLITNPDDLTRFVKLFTGGYHQYSMRNIILAWLQCPEMSLLAGYQDWQKKGRNVMKGQTGLRIFAPNTYKKVDDKTGDEEYGISGFRLAATFDVSQTGVAKTISTPDGKTFNILDPLDSTGLERGAEEYIQNPKNLKRQVHPFFIPVRNHSRLNDFLYLIACFHICIRFCSVSNIFYKVI